MAGFEVIIYGRFWVITEGTYLSRVERGRVTPSIFTLMQIAGAVGVEKIVLRVRASST
jgi:transcriptional regulator with XRE-family HTH domain